MLNNYVKQVRRLCGDASFQALSQFDVVDYINQARRQLAMEGFCIRKPIDVETVAGQEVYPFSAVNLSGFAGVQSIFMVGGITVIWGTWQFTLLRKSFGAYQAWIRTYTNNYQDCPSVWAQVGDGDMASAHQYPIPNDIYAQVWDCYLLPLDLTRDDSVEAIPTMFQPAVQYYAAYLALIGLGTEGMDRRADNFFKLYGRFLRSARMSSEAMFVSNWYGRSN